jgi:hypothetical protein
MNCASFTVHWRMQIFLLLILFLTPLISSAKWQLGEPRVWVAKGQMVGGIIPKASNNNVSIEMFENRLFMVFRSSKDHFASNETITYVLSSSDMGNTWQKELDFATGADVREGLLKSIGGALHLYYFEGGDSAMRFQPKHVLHRVRAKDGKWSEGVAIAGPEEVVWELKEHQGKIYKTSYNGPHYSFLPADIKVKLEVSEDGHSWKGSPVYFGGISEVAFEFDDEGHLWGVGRNEDGDTTGFGAQIFHAKAGEHFKWTALTKSLPHRYDSPRMFKHHGEIYLLSRKASHQFDRDWKYVPFNLKRWIYLGLYSLNSMKTALFRLNRKTKNLEWVLDLPSSGDNSFPSVVQLEKNKFLIANYTSPLEHQDWTWIQGQKSEEGTQIYGVELTWKD